MELMWGSTTPVCGATAPEEMLVSENVHGSSGDDIHDVGAHWNRSTGSSMVAGSRMGTNDTL